MKKTYIKPETVVVALNVHESILQASRFSLLSTPKMDDTDDFAAREVVRQDIKTQDPWEEW